MKISELGPLHLQQLRRTKGAGSSTAFDDLLAAAEESVEAGEAPATQQTSQTAAPAALGNLLSLQELPDALSRRRKALNTSRQSVDMLENLRRDMLVGRLGLSCITKMQQQLTQLAEQKRDNPEMAPLLDEIELRLAVEHAKLERAAKLHH